MYKRTGKQILILQIIILIAIYCFRLLYGMGFFRIAIKDLAITTTGLYTERHFELEPATKTVSTLPVLEVRELEHRQQTNMVDDGKVIEHNLSGEDLENLYRIVEAEAGGEDYRGKQLVANVVMNRVDNKQFPDTVTEVIFQYHNGKPQFSPVAHSRFYSLTVSDETKEAVSEVLQGTDDSEGALYFAARKKADQESMGWFDQNLEYLFAHGGHEFFK